MKKRKVIFTNKQYLWVVIIFLFPFAAHADVCLNFSESVSFSKSSTIKSEYFEEYYIEKRADAYFVYAVKVAELNFYKLVKVLNDFDKFPDFMPGYRSTKIQRISDTQLLTEIGFRPSFSPFLSRFTNEVEINSDSTLYQQCWQQLNSTDARVIKPFKNAPIHNKGYWEILVLDNERVRITYFSFIQPSVWIPVWLYRFIVTNSYVNTFKAIIQQAEKITANE